MIITLQALSEKSEARDGQLTDINDISSPGLHLSSGPGAQSGTQQLTFFLPQY